MPERFVLHVGLMKSGTSFVQHVLRKNRVLLRERGVLYPGGWNAQVRAVRDIILEGVGTTPPLAADGPWSTLMRRAATWPGTAAVSMEFLGPRRVSKIAQIVASLPADDVRVVVTVRDLARTIPSMWQEHVQNWGQTTWPEYLTGIEREDRDEPGPGREFWKRQDAPGIVSRWAEVVGRENVVVLTVPQPGAPRELLWQRFAQVLDVDPGGVDLDVPSNPALGVPSLVVLQAVNRWLRDQENPLSAAEYERGVKRGLAKQVLAGRDEPRLGLDAPWVVRRGERDIDLIRSLRVPVVGDLDELRCAPVPGVDIRDVTTEDLLASAVQALAQTTDHRIRRQRRRS